MMHLGMLYHIVVSSNQMHAGLSLSVYLSPARQGADYSVVRAVPRLYPYAASDKTVYVAHGLALLHEIRTS